MKTEDSEPSGISSIEVDEVAIISIDRPHVRNSLDRASVAALITAFEGTEAARCIILRSEGTSFCSGGNLQHLERLSSMPSEIRHSIESSFQRLIRTIRARPVPVIARIQGPAVGAGADLALACDLRVASRDAWLKESWMDLGVISPLGAVVNLTLTGGPAFALDALLTGRRIKADEALARGLFQRVVEPTDLDTEVQEMARAIVARNPDGVRSAKALVSATSAEMFEASLALGLDLQERLMRSPEFADRVRGLLQQIRESAANSAEPSPPS